MEPNRPTADPEAPIIVVGRARPFLDVRWLVDDAEEHLADDCLHRVLHPLDVACYDRYGRPLDLTLRADGTVRLSVSDTAPEPAALRDRLTAVCAEARDAHPTVVEEDRCDLGELDLPGGDLPELAVALAERFDHRREPPAPCGDGGGNGHGPLHSGSRLHNFWHAIS